VNTPSEFTGNPYDVGDMIDGTDRPECEFDMSCVYCAHTNQGCQATTVPNDFEEGNWTPPVVDNAGDDAECEEDDTNYEWGDDDDNWEDNWGDDNW